VACAATDRRDRARTERGPGPMPSANHQLTSGITHAAVCPIKPVTLTSCGVSWLYIDVKLCIG